MFSSCMKSLAEHMVWKFLTSHCSVSSLDTVSSHSLQFPSVFNTDFDSKPISLVMLLNYSVSLTITFRTWERHWISTNIGMNTQHNSQQVDIHIYTLHIHTHIHIHICTHMHIYTYTYTHIYISTYIDYCQYGHLL